ncbi:MAG: DUF4157 domain-containing protein [Deltaproteobacteria bacterium]|nr:DUF4157 domain-containing protein [Deltaproteobacteria bacterium]
MAEQVMRQPEEGEEEEEKYLQPKEFPGRSNEVTPALSSSIHSLRGGGQPLSENDRAFFEPHFGYDFSQVRVHTNAEAVESTRAANAQAYTGIHRQAESEENEPELFEEESLGPGFRRTGPLGKFPIGENLPYREATAYVECIRVMGPESRDYCDEEVLGIKRPVPLCPEVGDPKTRGVMRRVLCVSEMKKEPPDCRFTERQKIILHNAKREANSRVRRAYVCAKAGKKGALFARELADNLFDFDPPSVVEVKKVLWKVGNFLSGSGVEFAAKGCGERACQSGATVAYVTAAGTMPIYICPLAFASPDKLYKTIIHEALHWSGIDADPSTPEGYCEQYDCVTPCLTKKDADAWAHYLGCLGDPLELTRYIVRLLFTYSIPI